MYILTQAEALENCENNIIRVSGSDLEIRLVKEGCQRYERTYQLKDRHKEYTVICQEFRNSTMGTDPVLVVPEFHVPGRPYPLYVYLYAIDIYSANPEKSQRWAAEETRRFFGLATFAHTTLGRALKKLVRNIGEDGKAAKDAKADTTEVAEAKKPSFPSVRKTAALREAAAQFLRGELSHSNRKQSVSTCCAFAYKWFMKHGRFLL